MQYRITDGELYHHGVKGQKWGVRRYQNKDGSLTSAGKQRSKAELKPKPNAKTLTTDGEKYAKKMRRKKVQNILYNTVAITSGSLFVASMLVPGSPVIMALSNASRIAGMGMTATNVISNIVESN